MTISLRTLGIIDVSRDGGGSCDALLAQPKRLGLLIHLAVEAQRRWCRRDELLALLWPELDEDRGRGALRKALHFLRQTVGDGVILTRGDEVSVDLSTTEVDACALRAAARAGEHERAADLYQGQFLSGFFVTGADGFERWVAETREQLRGTAAAAAWEAATRYRDSGEFTTACAWAGRAARLAPDSELAARRFIELLARSGDRTAALAAYREFAARLERELGVQPSPGTDRAIRALLAAPPDMGDGVAPALPARTVVAEDGGVAAATVAVPVPAIRARSVWRRGAVIAATFALAATGWIGLRAARASDPVAGRIAVMPFDVRPEPDLRYLSDGLAVLLGMRLDGAGDLIAVDPRTLLRRLESASGMGNAAPTAARAREEAEWLGATLFVTGAAMRAGGDIVLDAALYDRHRDGEPVARAQVTGPEHDLLRLVDALASRLVAGRLARSGATIASSAAGTTTSIPALKEWLRGESSFRAGRFGDAADAFQNAVRIDSSFALAHFRLAVAANWAGRVPLVLPAAKRAAELAPRLPARTRALVEAFHATRLGRTGDAVAQYERAIAEDPNDAEAWFELAEARFHVGPMTGRGIAEAREAFERVWRLDPSNIGAMIHLARIAAAREDKAGLDSLTRAVLALDPKGSHRTELLMLRSFALRDAAAAREVQEIARSGIAPFDALWRSAEYTGALAEVSALAWQFADRATTPADRASLLLIAAHADAGRADGGESPALTAFASHAPRAAAGLRALFAAMVPSDRTISPARLGAMRASIDGERDDTTRRAIAFVAGSAHRDVLGVLRHYYTGLLSLREGDVSDATARLHLLDREMGRTPGPLYMEARAHLAALIDLKEGRPELALARIDSMQRRAMVQYASPSPLLPRAAIHLAASEALQRLGRHAEALERLYAVPEDFGFDLALLPEVRRRRAALLTRLGRADDAARERAWLATLASAAAPRVAADFAAGEPPQSR